MLAVMPVKPDRLDQPARCKDRGDPYLFFNPFHDLLQLPIYSNDFPNN